MRRTKAQDVINLHDAAKSLNGGNELPEGLYIKLEEAVLEIAIRTLKSIDSSPGECLKCKYNEKGEAEEPCVSCKNAYVNNWKPIDEE